MAWFFFFYIDKRKYQTSWSPRRRKPRRGPLWCAASVVGPKSAAVAADGDGALQVVVVVVAAHAAAARTTVIAISSCVACRSASSSIWRSPSRTVFWRWPGLAVAALPDRRQHLRPRCRPTTDRNRRTHRSGTWWDRCCSRHHPSTGSANRPAPWSWANLWISIFANKT